MHSRNSNLTFASRKGQSIVEALIALSILTIGLLGVLGLLSHSLYLQRETADQAKATYLASEGIEVAKNLIDHNVYIAVSQESQGVKESAGWNGGVAWNDHPNSDCFNFGTGGAQYYYLDFQTYSCPVQAGSSAPRTLYIAPDAQGVDHYYATDVAGAVASDFKRVVEISRPTANKMLVQSTVTWSAGNLPTQSITLEDTFYNWHP